MAKRTRRTHRPHRPRRPAKRGRGGRKAREMSTERPEPILPTRNLAETRAFYARLGFAAWFNGRWGGYEIVSRGQLVVHFAEDPTLRPAENPAGCYWRVRDADQLHREFAALGLPADGIPRLTLPEDKEWGMREFALVDPSGNLVRVGHDLDAASPRSA